MKKFILDTNLYIDALRNAAAAILFEGHYRALLPSIHMSSVVVQELLAGAESQVHSAKLERDMLRPFERRGRIVAPSHEAWRRSGQVLAALARRNGLDLRRVPKSFVNDILIALSCREAGATLVTNNLDDFARIRAEVDFEYTAPWPG